MNTVCTHICMCICARMYVYVYVHVSECVCVHVMYTNWSHNNEWVCACE